MYLKIFAFLLPPHLLSTVYIQDLTLAMTISSSRLVKKPIVCFEERGRWESIKGLEIFRLGNQLFRKVTWIDAHVLENLCLTSSPSFHHRPYPGLNSLGMAMTWPYPPARPEKSPWFVIVSLVCATKRPDGKKTFTKTVF